jgi:hypothetical protein
VIRYSPAAHLPLAQPMQMPPARTIILSMQTPKSIQFFAAICYGVLFLFTVNRYELRLDFNESIPTLQ